MSMSAGWDSCSCPDASSLLLDGAYLVAVGVHELAIVVVQAANASDMSISLVRDMHAVESMCGSWIVLCYFEKNRKNTLCVLYNFLIHCFER